MLHLYLLKENRCMSLEKYWKDYNMITSISEVENVVYVNKTRFNIWYTEMYDVDSNLIWYITYNDE